MSPNPTSTPPLFNPKTEEQMNALAVLLCESKDAQVTKPMAQTLEKLMLHASADVVQAHPHLEQVLRTTPQAFLHSPEFRSHWQSLIHTSARLAHDNAQFTGTFSHAVDTAFNPMSSSPAAMEKYTSDMRALLDVKPSVAAKGFRAFLARTGERLRTLVRREPKEPWDANFPGDLEPGSAAPTAASPSSSEARAVEPAAPPRLTNKVGLPKMDATPSPAAAPASAPSPTPAATKGATARHDIPSYVTTPSTSEKAEGWVAKTLGNARANKGKAALITAGAVGAGYVAYHLANGERAVEADTTPQR